MKRITLIAALLSAALLLAATPAGQARSSGAVADVTPPEGVVWLPAAVNSTAVELALDLIDVESGVLEVRASGDGVTWSEWAALPTPAGSPAVPRLPWNLTDDDGAKTVVVEARNGAGLVATFTATTVLDRVAPVMVATEPADGADLSAVPSTVTVGFSEALSLRALPVASIAGGPDVAAGVQGAVVRIVPRVPMSPGHSYAISLGGVRDLAGNPAAPVQFGFTVAPGAGVVRLASDRLKVTYGASAVVKGRVTPAGATVDLLRRRATETEFTRVASVVSSSTGGFTFRRDPSCTTVYRVEFQGTAEYLPAADEVEVAVKPVLTFATPSEFWRGQTATFKVGVRPAHPGAPVTVYRKIAGAWTAWRTGTLDADSRFRLTWKPSSYGISYFRAGLAADADHTAALSSSKRVVVNNPNPHHISVLYRHFIVIDISECHLYYYESGRVVRRIDVVLGKPSTPTPRGQWAVYTKSVNPGGPFGVFAMFYYRGYGIHGTNEPYLLSLWPRYFSHGCCRMYNSQITWLYPRCPIGTPVRNVW